MGQVMKNKVGEVYRLKRSKVIDDYLKEKLSPRFYDFWMKITEGFPLPFEKASSSSGKYHQSTAGTVHNLEEHTMEMLQFVDKLARIFGDSKEEQFYDILLCAIALHDIQKYGEKNQLPHTTKEHGVVTATLVEKKGVEFGLTLEEVGIMSGLILYHDGRWNSTNPGFKPIIPFTQLQLFVHIADMASSRRILNFE
jgi:23S rRNA maturation-related 3'-5' exoribonuclease YhaM